MSPPPGNVTSNYFPEAFEEPQTIEQLIDSMVNMLTPPLEVLDDSWKRHGARAIVTGFLVDTMIPEPPNEPLTYYIHPLFQCARPPGSPQRYIRNTVPPLSVRIAAGGVDFSYFVNTTPVQQPVQQTGSKRDYTGIKVSWSDLSPPIFYHWCKTAPQAISRLNLARDPSAGTRVIPGLDLPVPKNPVQCAWFNVYPAQLNSPIDPSERVGISIADMFRSVIDSLRDHPATFSSAVRATKWLLTGLEKASTE